jgi:hypothetical protein
LASITVCVITVIPAFAEVSISVGTIDRYADGADVPITIYEDENPGADILFSFELYKNDEIISDGTGTTDTNGEALIEFSELPSDTRFTGEVWVGDYDDPEAAQTFSFSTDSSLEEKFNINACNIGGIGLIWLALIGLSAMFKKKR